jgi:preprotein translocase subunit SecA
MIQKIVTFIIGTKQQRDLKNLIPIVEQINFLEPELMSWTEDRFKERTHRLREEYRAGKSLDEMLPEAFAMAREAGRRILGERIFDVQLMGGIVLHRGAIMEMKTGEGKTLSSVPTAYLNALSGKGVNIVTVNDYLAERDSQWMGPVYRYLGVSVGCILSQMDNEARREAYSKDITYGTNNEFGFDYLRDNMKWDKSGKVQRGHNFCIVDEIDSILIDEARTPLIISGPAEDDTATYYEVNRLVSSLGECAKDPETGEYPENPIGDYKIDEKGKRITFTDQGMNHIESLLQKRGIVRGSLFDSENFEYIHYFTQSLKAHTLFHRDVDYVIQEGKVQIVDEFTGRILYGRRYSEGLHQAIEAKERIKIAQRNRTLATITFQNYFRMYKKLSGMTGTADTEAKEFDKIYGLDVVVLPSNRPVVRDDRDDLIFLGERDKFQAICREIERLNVKGQPILVGTVSIEKSEMLSRLLIARGIHHEILNAKNHHREALIIAEAGAKGSVTIATNMAGRGTDIKLGGNPEYRALKKAGTGADRQTYERIYQSELERWQKDYEEVKSLGGLHVLGTERHEARRIDNQLRGRSGRQGDPGSSRFFISLDDVLMRLFGGENLKSLMSRVGMREEEPIMHPWINSSIERAQTRVEERNFEIRKHLLEFDDVLNEQRNFIYSRREEIITDDNLKERVMRTIEEILTDIFEDPVSEKSRDYSEILSALRDEFFYTPSIPEHKLADMTSRKLYEYVLNYLKQDMDEKEEGLGKENFNAFIRFEYLRNIDSRWQDHLENLEALREAVYLRTYAQKNPLLEYKLEGFQIFDQMLMDIRTAIARKIIKVKIHTFEGRNLILERENIGDARHRVLGQFALPAHVAAAQSALAQASASAPAGRPARRQAALAQAERDEAAPQNVQVRRSTQKVGRNDPCPCGSGKKYKHCCGR